MKALSDPIEVGRFLARLGRPQNVIYSGFLALLLTVIGDRPWLGVTLFVLLACLYNLAAGYNNLQDTAIDQYNHNAHNPLIFQAVGLRIIYVWLVLNIVTILGLQIWLPQPSSIILTLVAAALLWAYSNPRTYVQGRGYWAIILLAFYYGSLPVLLAGAPLDIPWTYPLAALQIPLVAASLLAKDYKDEAGDRVGGKRTPLVRYGVAKVQVTAWSCWLAGSVGVVWFALSAASVSVRSANSISLLLLTYGICVVILHRRRGVVPRHFRRIPQALLLVVNGLLVTALL